MRCLPEAADPERGVRGRAWSDRRLRGGGHGAGRRWVVEEVGCWYEEEIAGERCREVEDPVVVAGWLADEHVRQHLLDHFGAAGVADEVGAELACSNPTKWHVEAHDLPLLAVGV